jgi:hypothetical protein
MRISSRASAVSAVLLLCLVGCSTSEWQTRKHERSIARAAAVLEQNTDADSLAAAAILHMQGGDHSAALPLLARATAAAPVRPDLAWLHVQICLASSSCDSAPLEARFREIDSSNGAAWMAALTRADTSRDEAAKDTALLAIARTERVDIYWNALIAHLSEATARTKQISLPTAINVVIGFLAATAIPPYASVSNACKGDRLNRADVLESCRAAAKALESGDTYITEMIGVAIAKRVWPADSREWKDAEDRRRLYRYRSQHSHGDDAVLNVAAAEKYITLLSQHHREQDYFRAQMIADGENPDPPASFN